MSKISWASTLVLRVGLIWHEFFGHSTVSTESGFRMQKEGIYFIQLEGCKFKSMWKFWRPKTLCKPPLPSFDILNNVTLRNRR